MKSKATRARRRFPFRRLFNGIGSGSASLEVVDLSVVWGIRKGRLS